MISDSIEQYQSVTLIINIHTAAFILPMMVVQLSKKFIKIILVGDPVVLRKQQPITLKDNKPILFFTFLEAIR